MNYRIEYYEEGRLTEYGDLEILRGGKLVKLECPYSAFAAGCKECCPLLGEPEKSEEGFKMILCGVTLEFKKFTDERKR